MQDDLLTELEMMQNYQFLITFDDEGMPEIRSDEPRPLGEGKYPNAVRYLSAAIGNCLCASLAFCLRRAHSEPISIKATVHTTLGRNEMGRLRVTGIDVVIHPEVDDPAKLERCIPLFQDFCTVSAAVKEGIDIKVSVEPIIPSIK